jgi:flotillin
MHVKAAAFLDYNQAAVIDRIVGVLPQVVNALAQPLNNVDKITVVSTGDGNGSGAGVNRVTADIAQMVAQVPALVEGLTGVDVSQMIQDIPAVRQNGASGGRAGKFLSGASVPATARAEGPQPKQVKDKDKEIVASGESMDGN